MVNFIHHGDVPDDFEVSEGGSIAIDTETMGLIPWRDRLCVVQLSTGDGDAHLVKFDPDASYQAPNLVKILKDEKILKIFHFARFDMAVLQHYLGAMPEPVYCTRMASYLCRTYTDRHGLKDLCRELIDVEISKQQQSSDWGAKTLSEARVNYAAGDVLYLHQLKARLDVMLEREGRTGLAQAGFDFLKNRVELDLAGFAEKDIFSHSM